MVPRVKLSLLYDYLWYDDIKKRIVKNLMRIFISGVSCVGKTTIGEKLADNLGYFFYDLDQEIEIFFSMPIEKLQSRFLTIYSFRKEASKALIHILKQENSKNAIITLPPSGLMSYYWQVIKKSEGIKIVLTDQAENILKRITFYDENSKLIQKKLSSKDKLIYLKEIKKDITYFKQSYKRADIMVDISNLNIIESAKKIKDIIGQYNKLKI